MTDPRVAAFNTAYDNFLAGVDIDTTMLDCAEFMFNAGRESILQSKEVLPPLPQPAIYGESICCGNFTTGGEYMGQQENICCGRFEESTPDYYTAGQVYHYAMRVLAGQGRLIDSDMHDEIADVLIMMHQMANIYGIDHVRARVRHKMGKLAAKLAKAAESTLKTEEIK